MSSQKDNTVIDAGVDSTISPRNTGIVLDSMYTSLVTFCKREEIPLKLTRDNFILGYTHLHPVADTTTLAQYFEQLLNTVQLHKVSDEPAKLGLVIGVPGQGGVPLVNPAMSPQQIGGSADFIDILKGEASNMAREALGKAGKAIGDAARQKTQAMMEDIAGGILNNRGGTQGPGQGGGGRGETFGGVGNIQPINANFSNYEHPTVKLDYSMGIPGTTIGTSPFDAQFSDPNDKSKVLESCLTLKVLEFNLPMDDDFFKTYFDEDWIPFVREALQGEKRLNSNLALLFTPERMRTYLQKVATAMQIYHFFINVFNYCRLSDGMNQNAGLRYLREEMFTTTNLQKLSLLRSRLDSLPWPQTLDSEIAYHSLIYTQSDAPFSGMRMNVPDVFLSALPVYGTTEKRKYSVITSLQPNVIQDQLDSLDYQDVTASEKESALKMIGAICNTTEFQKSRVGSFQFEPYTDPIYNNQFTNSGIESNSNPTATSADFAGIKIRYPLKGEHTYTPVNYYSYTNDVPGMLQATWTPAETIGGPNWLGFWKPRKLSTNYKVAANQECVTNGNIMFFISDKGPDDTLVDLVGDVAPKGGFMHVNGDIQSCWAANDFLQNPVWTRIGTALETTTVKKKPFGAQRIVNMSLDLNNYQRTKYWHQLMETPAWAFGRNSNSSDSKPRGKSKRFGKKEEKSDMED